MTHQFPFGLEEEYFLVDAETKNVLEAMPEAFFEAAKTMLGPRVHGELLQSQIEVTTTPHVEVAKARSELRGLRQAISRIAADHGLAIMAAGTHPTATWAGQRHSTSGRHAVVMQDLQMLAQRNLLCGLHVHVEVPDPDERVDLMTRMLPYLPLFVALATSSPFWQSQITGLKGYRLAAYDELPRTGVPELFRTKDEFDAYVAALSRAGVIEDSSFVWWALRPSLQHPTLELRAPDCCTLADDSIAIASLYRSLVRRLHRCPWLNWDLDQVGRAIVVENKWRAQRYGVAGTFVDGGAGGLASRGAGGLASRGGLVTVAEKLEQVIEETTADALALGCLAELRHCRAIVGAGTSADVQLAVYEAHERKEDSEQALRAVADWIAVATLQ